VVGVSQRASDPSRSCNAMQPHACASTMAVARVWAARRRAAELSGHHPQHGFLRVGTFWMWEDIRGRSTYDV
jgi:hypothetical protein